ncbi:hypothetical protein ANTPLA_LOCUS7930 [Anthophora plagiata]
MKGKWKIEEEQGCRERRPGEKKSKGKKSEGRSIKCTFPPSMPEGGDERVETKVQGDDFNATIRLKNAGYRREKEEDPIKRNAKDKKMNAQRGTCSCW